MSNYTAWTTLHWHPRTSGLAALTLGTRTRFKGEVMCGMEAMCQPHGSWRGLSFQAFLGCRVLSSFCEIPEQIFNVFMPVHLHVRVTRVPLVIRFGLHEFWIRSVCDLLRKVLWCHCFLGVFKGHQAHVWCKITERCMFPTFINFVHFITLDDDESFRRPIRVGGLPEHCIHSSLGSEISGAKSVEISSACHK